MSAPTIGFVGLGNMGLPMASNIAAAGFDLVGYDVAGTENRIPEGASSANSIAEVIQRADSVLLSVPDGTATLEIVDQIIATTDRRAKVVIDLSTVGPVAAQNAASALKPFGIAYVDGPVSGGVAGARAKTVALMFGGPTEIFESHRTLLASFSGKVFHVGESAGHGQAMKLLNNYLSATALAASSEAFALGQAYGLDLATMVDVVNVSTGRNSATSDKFPNRVLTGTYDTGFFTHLMAKDVRLFNSIAEQAGTQHTVSDAVEAIWDQVEAAMPGSDFSEIWKFTGERGHTSASVISRDVPCEG
jgi:3-hydroxyisobutyrate dehydrogenase